jgi:N utilization substance protein B
MPGSSRAATRSRRRAPTGLRENRVPRGAAARRERGAAELEQLIAAPRPRVQPALSGRAILYIGAYELAHHPKTPFKVVLNEAVELGKSFGGTDGYRFVNGVLEKIAQALRPEEVARSRKIA